MNEMKVYVVTHKNFKDDFLKSKNYYQVIKVGNNMKNSEAQKKNWQVDSEGNNISTANPYYCELTAQYWGWKNDKVDCYTGICHYRRYFLDPFIKKNTQIISKDSVINIMSKYDVILLYPEKKSIHAIIPKTIAEIDKEKNFAVIRKILLKFYPETINEYDKLIMGKKMIFRNMFITSKKIYDNYSSFLFDVLQKYDQEMLQNGYKRKLRIDGFEAEYLLPTYMLTYYKNIFYAECISPKDLNKKGIHKFYLQHKHIFYNVFIHLKERIDELLK